MFIVVVFEALAVRNEQPQRLGGWHISGRLRGGDVATGVYGCHTNSV